jgi:hypothetical protein
LLKDANVVLSTTDGKLYLSQRELGQEARWKGLLAYQVRAGLKRYTRSDGHSGTAT